MSVQNSEYIGLKIKSLQQLSHSARFLDYIENHNPKKLKNLLENHSANFDINYVFKFGEKQREYNAFQILCDVIVNIKEEDDPSMIESFNQTKDTYILCAQLLVDHGIDITYRDPDYKMQAIEHAVLTGEVEIVRSLVKKHQELGVSIANIDLISTVLLFFEGEEEMEEDFFEIIELLIDSGVDVNTLDYDTGAPPIYLAANMGFKDVVTLILTKRSYDVDLDYYEDEDGKTARMLINKYNLYEEAMPSKNGNGYHLLYKFMKERDINEFINKYKLYKEEMSDDKKCSFLLRSVKLGAEEIVEYLINETESIYNDYITLLEMAYKKGYYKVIEALFEEVPDIDYGIQHIQDLVKMRFAEKTSANFADYNKCLIFMLEKSIDLNQRDKHGKTVLEYAIERKNHMMIQILLKHGASLIVNTEKGHQKCLILDIHPDVLQSHFDDSVYIHSNDEECSKKRRKTKSTRQCIDYIINFSAIIPPRIPTDDTNIHPCCEDYPPEMTALKTISKESEYCHLLEHPMASIFVTLKWFRIRKFFYTDVLLYTLHAILLNTYIFLPDLKIFYVGLAIIYPMSLFWETIQMVIFRLIYFTYLDSWTKFFLSLLTSFIIILHYFKYQLEEDILTQLYAVTSLISILNFAFLIGHFPHLSTSVIMIKAIYKTFLISLLSYFFLILAFSTAFFILFRDNYSLFFENYTGALFKTVIMATGEYDTANLGLSRYPYVSHLMVVFFVTLISVSLMNLLTGLAVSDIQDIKKNAELHSQVNIISRVSRFEQLFLRKDLKKRFSFLTNICLFSVFDRETSVGINSRKRTVEMLTRGPVPVQISKHVWNCLMKVVQKKQVKS